MSQADLTNGAQASGADAALDRLELNVELLDIAFHELVELLAAEEERPPPPALPASRARRHRQLRHTVKLRVIGGGLGLLVAAAFYLPAQVVPAPVRTTVDYTVKALVHQLPEQVPDPSDLGPVVIGNPDYKHQPLRPVAMIKALLPSTDAASVSGPTPALAPPSPPPASQIPLVTAAPTVATAPTSAPATPAPTAIPVVTPSRPPPSTAPAPAPAPPPSAAPASVPAIVDPVLTPTPTAPPTPEPTPVPTPTILPSEPAPVPSGVGSPPSPEPTP